MAGILDAGSLTATVCAAVPCGLHSLTQTP